MHYPIFIIKAQKDYNNKYYIKIRKYHPESISGTSGPGGVFNSFRSAIKYLKNNGFKRVNQNQYAKHGRKHKYIYRKIEENIIKEN